MKQKRIGKLLGHLPNHGGHDLSTRSQIKTTASMFESAALPASPRAAAPGLRPRRAAFTLVEMLVVVLIMALLIGLLVRTLGGAGEQSDKATTLAKIEKVKAALEEFYAEYGQYPPVPFYKEEDMTYYDADNKKQTHDKIQPLRLDYPVEFFGDGAQWSGTAFLSAFSNAGDDPGKRLFTLGLVSFLVPRYETVQGGSPYLKNNKSSLTGNKQWNVYTPSQRDEQRDLDAIERWKPYLDGVISGGQEFYCKIGETTHHINLGSTIRDAWENELRYESLPPHQSYKLWSKGRNGRDEEGRGDDLGIFMKK